EASVRCRFCGSVLPDRTLFCGECGRAASGASAGAVSAAHPIVDRPLTVAAPTPDPGVSGVADACEACGSSLAPSDIFCGECGYVTRAVSAADTVVVDRVEVQPDAAAASPEVSDGPPVAEPRAETPVSEESATFILQFSTG